MKTNFSKKHALSLLKIIGIILFIWIFSQIDREQILQTILHANKQYLLLSFFIIFLIYGVKNIRWQQLTHAGGVKTSMYESWRIFMIGVFLATITPGKAGELGRAAYLKKAGMKTKYALFISIADRLCDVLCISILVIGAVGILFGIQIAVIIGACALAGGILCLFFLRKYLAKKKLLNLHTCILIVLSTICAWCLYFTWAILIARAVGIDVSAVVMIATLTVTGILSLLPIAPSGLGTREAALITLLAPYGIEPERAVALAFIMFISIILSGILGGFYWIKGVKIAAHQLQ